MEREVPAVALDPAAANFWGLDFELPHELSTREPAEARGLARDQVRLLVGRRDSGAVSHHRFTELPEILMPGDVLVVNTSETMPAAVDVLGRPGLALHASTELPEGSWVIELRERIEGGATQPYRGGESGDVLTVSGGARVRLLRPYTPNRLWVSEW